MSSAWPRFSPSQQSAARAVNETPGRIEDYEDREGFNPDFFEEAAIGLPGLGVWAVDAVTLELRARRPKGDPHELAYNNFSVVISASRRLPLFSMVNIAGALSDRDVPRTNMWKYDPRVETRFQIIREIYGAEERDLFSRGHMTRREDPNWGPAPAVADADTFHVTNAAPQRQRFNGGIWLDLENYILNNVDQEDIKATVVTGPIFREEDPTYQGIRTPVEFWKIVVFRHPELSKLTAIAYKRSQAQFLPRLGRREGRFIFGDFEDTQVSVVSLEEETGLDLAAFRELDVMRNADPRLVIGLRRVEDAFLTP